MLLLHFMMKEYGGYPDRWLEQDWEMCEALFTVNSIIQKVKEREKKKAKAKQNKK